MRALFVKSRTLTPTPLPGTGEGLQAVSELFNDDVAVGVDADVAGDLERFGGDGLRVESGVRKQRARGGQRERAAGADRDQTIPWFDHVTGAADDQGSEERRVGKGCVSTCRSRWATVQYKKNNNN